MLLFGDPVQCSPVTTLVAERQVRADWKLCVSTVNYCNPSNPSRFVVLPSKQTEVVEITGGNPKLNVCND